MASEEIIFEYIFINLSFRLPWQPIKFSGLDRIYMFGRGLFKEHFCKMFVKISAVRQQLISVFTFLIVSQCNLKLPQQSKCMRNGNKKKTKKKQTKKKTIIL